jgi:hypothetical protein
VMTMASGTFDVPLPSDAVPAPDSTPAFPGWVSHLFAVPEYAGFYVTFMQGRGWIVDFQDSKLDPSSTKDNYFYYYSFCKPGVQPVVDVTLIVGALGTPPFPADIATIKGAEIGLHSVPSDSVTCKVVSGNPPPTASPVAAQTVVTFINAPLTGGRGSNATLQVKTAPNTSCSIEVDYKSGPSTAAGLVVKTSDGAGNVSWTWKVGANTTPGAWPITVTCGAGSAQTHITVT